MKKPKIKPENKSKTIRIEGGMTICQVLALRQILLDSIIHSSDIDIDLSAVDEIDTAGVQLLILAKRTALSQHRELNLIGHSPAVLDVFELLNLFEYFDNSSAMHIHPESTISRPQIHSNSAH